MMPAGCAHSRDHGFQLAFRINEKQRARDPNAGYARDFVSLMREILPVCVERDIKVMANAGGVNARGCAEAVRGVGRELGLGGKFKIGLVSGDDIMGRLDDMLARGVEVGTWTRANRSRRCATKSRARTSIWARSRWWNACGGARTWLSRAA